MGVDIPSLIVAVGGVLSIAASVYMNRSGARDTARQQVAANELTRRSQAWEESEDTIDRQARDLARQRYETRWERRRADAYRAALRAAGIDVPEDPAWRPPRFDDDE